MMKNDAEDTKYFYLIKYMQQMRKYKIYSIWYFNALWTVNMYIIVHIQLRKCIDTMCDCVFVIVSLYVSALIQ